MIDPQSGYHLDESGNIVLRPVTGWITGTAAQTGVILAIQYIETLEQFGNAKQEQFVMTPEQALELSDRLRTLAQKVITPSPAQKLN